jgi:hypothetical protein
MDYLVVIVSGIRATGASLTTKLPLMMAIRLNTLQQAGYYGIMSKDTALRTYSLLTITMKFATYAYIR